MARPSRSPRASSRGITPLELAIAIAIAGCALAATVPACVRAVQVSRQAEAVEATERLLNAAIVVRNEAPATQLLSAPLTPASVPRGQPVADDPSAWDQPTWRALGFAFDQPHWYAYRLDVDPDPQTALRVVAQGDLNGNGVLSSYERSASRQGNTIVARPALIVTADLE